MGWGRGKVVDIYHLCQRAFWYCVSKKKYKELIIFRALQSIEGRTALSQAMVEPIRRAMEYQSVGRKLFMPAELPQETLDMAAGDPRPGMTVTSTFGTLAASSLNGDFYTAGILDSSLIYSNNSNTISGVSRLSPSTMDLNGGDIQNVRDLVNVRTINGVDIEKIIRHIPLEKHNAENKIVEPSMKDLNVEDEL